MQETLLDLSFEALVYDSRIPRAWGVCQKNSSMRIELFRDNKLPDREAEIFDIWNDKVEAKVAKFLDFAKN